MVRLAEETTKCVGGKKKNMAICQVICPQTLTLQLDMTTHFFNLGLFLLLELEPVPIKWLAGRNQKQHTHKYHQTHVTAKFIGKMN